MLSAKIENLFLQAMSMAHDVTPGIPCTCGRCNQWRQELREAICAELDRAQTKARLAGLRMAVGRVQQVSDDYGSSVALLAALNRLEGCIAAEEQKLK